MRRVGGWQACGYSHDDPAHDCAAIWNPAAPPQYQPHSHRFLPAVPSTRHASAAKQHAQQAAPTR